MEEKSEVLKLALGRLRGRRFGVPEENNDGQNLEGSEGSARIPVTMVKVINPGEFYVTMDDMNEKYVELQKLMNKVYNNLEHARPIFSPNVVTQTSPGRGQSPPAGDTLSALKKLRKWEPGDTCAIKVEGQWKRCVVVAEPFETVEVRLVDEVQKFTLPLDALRRLQLEFRRLVDRVTRCCLGGIQPIDDSWTKSSISELHRFSHGYPNLYIRKMNNYNPDADLSVLPVELFGSRIGEASLESLDSLNQQLCEKGFANPAVPLKNNRSSERQVWNVMEDDSNVLAYLMNEYFKTTNQEVNRGVPKASKTKWFPVEPLDPDIISGKVTFVGNNCEIYIQNCEPSAVQTLEDINDEVQRLCERTEPSDDEWEVGDICLARFDLDGKWYRGEILQVNTYQGHHYVRFVDYGNSEYLRNDDLRLAVGLTMRPLQVHMGFFDNFIKITPEWELPHLKGIHKLLADKISLVTLRKLKSGFLGIVDMYLPDGGNAIDLLVSEGFGQYLYPPDGDDKDIFWGNIFKMNLGIGLGSGYKLLEIPDVVDSFSVEIPAVLSPDLFLIKICGTDNTELNLQLEAFIDLQASMQEEAENMPNCLPSDEMCGCISSYEGLWYRAAVLKNPSDTNTVTIQYVDYGNIEEKSVKELKHLKDVWYSVPTHAIPCCFHRFKYSGKIPRQEAIQTLQREFSSQNSINATIKKRRGKRLEVELRTQAGRLLYQDLIDSGVYVPR